MAYGDNLKRLRISHGYTQSELAEMVNVNQSTYCQYESSGKIPNMYVAIKLARILGTTVEDMIKEEQA